MTLVAGIDSSTQSCKVLIVEADSGRVVRHGTARHPEGTECHPDHWWTALQEAIDAAGGLDDVEAISVGGQQHGMVVLDGQGEVIRPALLWNDTRSATAAEQLIEEFGGPQAWANVIGSVPVASLTVTKLRWLADNEPDNAARVAAVCLPHDWLTWKLRGTGDLADLVTDRSDASGTGYFDSAANEYRRDLLDLAMRRDTSAIVLPTVLGPAESAGQASSGAVLGPGCGDNAGAALGLGLGPGDCSVSLGTSGVVGAVSPTPIADGSGAINGFADATGSFLHLAVTLNAAQILDVARKLLGVDHDELARLALEAAPGADGLILLPLFNGERVPNLPEATGTMLGMTMANMTPAHLARAFVEGMLCHLAHALGRLRALGTPIEHVSLVGGAGRSQAVRELIPGILGVDVVVPPDGEYVALGAARQAAWVLAGTGQPPSWDLEGSTRLSGEDQPWLRERYATALAEQEGLTGPVDD